MPVISSVWVDLWMMHMGVCGFVCVFVPTICITVYCLTCLYYLFVEWSPHLMYLDTRAYCCPSQIT